MLTHQRIVVADNTAGLRVILVVGELPECQVGQLPLVLLDVQDVRVGVHVLEAVGVQLQQLLEPVQARVKLCIIPQLPWLL